MKIERVAYRRVGDEVREYKKQILTKIDEHHYFTQAYLKTNGEWMNAQATTYFDGKDVHNGTVQYTGDDVDTKFKLMVEYEGYRVVED